MGLLDSLLGRQPGQGLLDIQWNGPRQQVGGFAPNNPAPQMPQMPPGTQGIVPKQQNRILSNPALAQALMAMGSGMLMANSRGMGGGAALGYGAQNFMQAMQMQQIQEQLKKKQEIEARKAELDGYEKYMAVKKMQMEMENMAAKSAAEKASSQEEAARRERLLAGLPENERPVAEAMGIDDYFTKRYENSNKAPAKPIEVGGKLIDPVTMKVLYEGDSTGSGKLGTDQMWVTDEQGNQIAQPIPGTKLDMETKAKKDKETKAIEADRAQAQMLIADIDDALAYEKDKRAGLDVTGGLAWAESLIPGTDADVFDKKVTSIKERLALDKLMEMKMNSPTGGVFGALSEGERAALASTAGVLDIASGEDTVKNLTRLREILKSKIGDAPTATGGQIMKTKSGVTFKVAE